MADSARPDQGRTVWLQNTPMPSEPSLSYSPGITRLLELHGQINALLSTFAGICSEQLTNFQQSTGTELMAPRVVAFVSTAKLNQELMDYIIRVHDAELALKKQLLLARLSREDTSESISKR